LDYDLLRINPNRYDNSHKDTLVCIGINNWINFDKLKALHLHNLSNPNLLFDSNFASLRKTTINTQYRDFQFKIMHGITSTRHKLYKFKYIPDNYCIFCNEQLNEAIKDDIFHSFFACPASHDTWLNSRAVINEKTSVLITIENNFIDIIYGFKNVPNIVNELAISIKKLLHKPMSCRKVINVVLISKMYDDLIQIRNSVAFMKINCKVK